MTQVYYDLASFSQLVIDTAVTIGNFDGVHFGHQQLISKLKIAAQTRNLPSVVIIFEPHPYVFFHRQQSFKQIMSLDIKIATLVQLGVDYVLCLKFDDYLANLSAQDFINKILVQGVHTKYLLVGDDFHFGYQRLGDFALLREQAMQCNYTVEAITSVFINSDRVSSRNIRASLTDKQINSANTALGRVYTMQGEIIRGQQLGRKLGYPTANIAVTPSLLLLPYGIYSVRARILGDNKYPNLINAIASLGIRPTVTDDQICLLEVHLFDFSDDIYNLTMQVEFYSWIRSEQKFDSLTDLTQQIARDVAKARAYFQKVEALHD